MAVSEISNIVIEKGTDFEVIYQTQVTDRVYIIIEELRGLLGL